MLPKVPDEAWKQLVDTTCDTLRELLLPMTATTGGLGRVIKADFDNWEADIQESGISLFQSLSEKLSRAKKSENESPKRKIIVQALREGVMEDDVVLRELWTNLLAQEITHGNVHPEFLMTLNRLSSQDAIVLANVAKSRASPVQLERVKKELESVKTQVTRLQQEIAERHKASGGKYTASKYGRGGRLKDLYSQRERLLLQIDEIESVAERTESFSHHHLAQLGLISKAQGIYCLTDIGDAFIRAVSEPT